MADDVGIRVMSPGGMDRSRVSAYFPNSRRRGLGRRRGQVEAEEHHRDGPRGRHRGVHLLQNARAAHSSDRLASRFRAPSPRPHFRLHAAHGEALATSGMPRKSRDFASPCDTHATKAPHVPSAGCSARPRLPISHGSPPSPPHPPKCQNSRATRQTLPRSSTSEAPRTAPSSPSGSTCQEVPPRRACLSAFPNAPPPPSHRLPPPAPLLFLRCTRRPSAPPPRRRLRAGEGAEAQARLAAATRLQRLCVGGRCGAERRPGP